MGLAWLGLGAARSTPLLTCLVYPCHTPLLPDDVLAMLVILGIDLFDLGR